MSYLSQLLHAFSGCNETVFLVPSIPRYDQKSVCNIDQLHLSLTSSSAVSSNAGIFDLITKRVADYRDYSSLFGSHFILPYSLEPMIISSGSTRYISTALASQWQVLMQFYIEEIDICPSTLSGWIQLEVSNLIVSSPSAYHPITTSPAITLSMTPCGLPVHNLNAEITVNEEKYIYEFPVLDYCRLMAEVSFPGDFLSYAISVNPLSKLDGKVIGFGSSVFVEHIPTREQLDAENRAVPFYNETLRHYSRMWKDFRPDSVIFDGRIGRVRDDAVSKWRRIQEEVSSTDNSKQNNSDGRVHMCMYFSDKMDGMKAKLLGVIRSLPETEFRFTFFACRLQKDVFDANYTTELYTQLSATGKDVDIRGCVDGITVARDNFSDRPHNSKSPFKAENTLEEYLSSFPDEEHYDRAMEYMYHRLVVAEYKVKETSPLWVQTVLTEFVNTISGRGSFSSPSDSCDVLVLGNDRMPVTSVITAVARSMNIVTVVELANLFPHRYLLPNYIVSDSLFGLSETNVKALLRHVPIDISNVDFTSIGLNGEVITQGVIISPGIDMQAFENNKFGNVYTFPWKEECGNNHKSRYKSSACFVVAFVARLAKEKAVGLFLIAVRDLLRIRPMVRVMIVGDGNLRREFESLASKLGIRWAVKFIGWQPRQILPLIYADVDVLVNTGAWKEIFNNANLEALCLGIPLVTFATGGVGEYIDAPHRHIVLDHDSIFERNFQFEEDIMTTCPNILRYDAKSSKGQVDVLNFLYNEETMRDTTMRLNETVKTLALQRCNSDHRHDRNVLIEIDVSTNKVSTLQLNDKLDLAQYLPFALSDNAVVIQSPTSEAVAQAVAFLESNRKIRSILSENGRQTVQSNFLMHKTVDAYRALLWQAADEGRMMRLVDARGEIEVD